MKFSVIVCTYERPHSLQRFLKSVKEQNLYPDQVLIIDGSKTPATKNPIEQHKFPNLDYHFVDERHRGLTRQRNFGISLVDRDAEVVFFFDDDVVLLPKHFEHQLAIYEQNPQAYGVGGYITNETEWKPGAGDPKTDFEFDGWFRKFGSRNVLRKKLGLSSSEAPGRMPESSHGLSTNYFPPSGQVYEVDYFMGCAMSFRREVFDHLKFSTFFEGYGLYEDMDFCLRVSRLGPLYLNTSAQLEHYHEPLGRPDKYKYGKMVIRNGWYVWRLKYPQPGLKARLKWHATALLLTTIRFGNAANSAERKEAFSEGMGRLTSWFNLFWNKPKIEN